MNAVRSILRCAEHQDVDPLYVILNPKPSERFCERVHSDDAWIAERSRVQDSLPEVIAEPERLT